MRVRQIIKIISSRGFIEPNVFIKIFFTKKLTISHQFETESNDTDQMVTSTNAANSQRTCRNVRNTQNRSTDGMNTQKQNDDLQRTFDHGNE